MANSSYLRLGFVGALLLAGSTMALADGTNIKGVITSRDGANMTVTGQDGTKTVITITDTTNVQQVEGSLGVRKDSEPATALIDGLPVSVDVVQNGTETDATAVKFKASDLKTAQMVQAGVAQEDAKLQSQVSANAANEADLRNHVANMDNYTSVADTTVLFAVNSTALSPAAKSALQAISAKAKATNGYLVSVQGFTDSSGNAAYNQKLSDERAAAVTAYLLQIGNIKPYRMLSPAAMSQSNPVGSNETASGKAENRRVTVNVLVSKGLQGL
ncbi:OmpA family protein [Polymorphobacter arshaanensis]|nr:OmpA family protein [Polymorphobacter arshaanensis]